MLLPIILGGVGLAIGLMMVILEKEPEYKAYGSFVVFFLCVLGAFVGLTFSIFIGFGLPTEFVFDRQIKLEEIQAIDDIQGRSFLAKEPTEVGFAPDFYYIFYPKQEGGMREFGRASSDKTVVNEEERDAGLIKIYKERFKVGWYSLIGIEPSDERYNIYIPQGSEIIQSFQIRR